MSTALISPGTPGRLLGLRRLARQDAASARLAELHRIRALLEDAAVVVSAGWVQRAWFSVVDGRGGTVGLTAYDVGRATHEPVNGACLVGGIVHAAGGPSAVRTQLVQRTLDLTWHTLHETPTAPVRWCPAPPVRAAHVRDLTRWNDDPRCTSVDVLGLLDRAVLTADLQLTACRPT